MSRARETAGQALELARECGERGHEAQALQMLGDLAAHGPRPDVADARERYAAAMRLAEELGLQPLVASCQSSLGSLDLLAGDETAAARRREQLDQDLRDWGFAVAPRRHG